MNPQFLRCYNVVMRKALRVGTLNRGVSLVLFAVAAILAETPAFAAPPIVDKWSLWSDGVRLRGANIYQRPRYPFDGPDFLGSGPVGPPYVQRDFDRLAALGANAVVLSHPGLFAENPPYAVDAGVQANLDTLITLASQAGLYSIIAFRTGPGRSEAAFGYFPDKTYDNDRVWTDQAAHDAWPEMWRYTAARYKDNPAVAGYELMVEPNSNGLFEIYEPVDFYPRYAGTLYDWNALFPSIIRAIREVDAVTPILVGGLSWSAARWLPFVRVDSDPRTVYTVHHYEPFDYTNQDVSRLLPYPGGGYDQPWLRATLEPIDEFRAANPGRPVAVTEFGVVRWAPGAALYFSDVTALLEEKRVNHFLWVWHASWPPMAESDEFDFLHGPDPAVHNEVASSPLLDAVRADFARNLAPRRRRAVRHGRQVTDVLAEPVLRRHLETSTKGVVHGKTA